MLPRHSGASRNPKSPFIPFIHANPLSIIPAQAGIHSRSRLPRPARYGNSEMAAAKRCSRPSGGGGNRPAGSSAGKFQHTAAPHAANLAPTRRSKKPGCIHCNRAVRINPRFRRRRRSAINADPAGHPLTIPRSAVGTRLRQASWLMADSDASPPSRPHQGSGCLNGIPQDAAGKASRQLQWRDRTGFAPDFLLARRRISPTD